MESEILCAQCQLFECYLNGQSEECIIDETKCRNNCVRWLANNGSCPVYKDVNNVDN